MKILEKQKSYFNEMLRRSNFEVEMIKVHLFSNEFRYQCINEKKVWLLEQLCLY